MTRKYWIPALLAVVLVLAMSIGPAWAYFTATTSAVGGITISVEPTTDIDEPVVREGVKHVVISADEKSKPVYVRVRAFWGDLADTVTCGGEGWTEGEDGWWYYGEILNGGEQSREFLVTVSRLLESKDDIIEGQNFGVVVVHEATPVQYDEDGVPFADWNITLDEWQEEGED